MFGATVPASGIKHPVTAPRFGCSLPAFTFERAVAENRVPAFNKLIAARSFD